MGVLPSEGIGGNAVGGAGGRSDEAPTQKRILAILISNSPRI